MASKKKGTGRDNFDDDLDFDIPDFGADNPAAVSNNRKPISTGLKSAAAGFGKTFTSEARLRQTLTKSIPKQYEEPISKAFEVKDGVRDLYNNVSKEANETIRETRRSVGRIARNLEPVIPKGLAERLKKFGNVDDDGSSSGRQSKEEIEQGVMNSAFTSIFADMQQNQADQQKKDNARQIMQDSVDRKRHGDLISILGSIDQSLIAMQTHEEKVGINYMKKNLELQFRQYFVQNDMLQLQSKFFQMFKDDLAAITKNTGLPDYVKKAPKEALLEHMREKAFDSVANTLSKKRNEWLGGVFKKLGDKASNAIGNFRDMSSQVLDTAEMMSSMAGSGMGPSKSEMVGDLAGGFLGGKVQNYLAKQIHKRASKNQKVLRFGNKADQFVTSMPQAINKFVQGGFNDNDKVPKWLKSMQGAIPEWLKDVVALDGESSSVRMNREVDMERATQFSNRNSRSLNVVIPELLSRIHQELYIGRTGDVNAKPLAYDYEKGKFVTKKESLQALSKNIVSDRTVQDTKYRTDSIFKEIDPEGKLDEGTRKKIAESIYGANKRNTYFDRDAMTSYGALGDHEGTGKARELIKAYLDKSPNGGNERRLSEMFSKVGNSNGDVKDIIQHFIDNGRQDDLRQIGVLTEDGYIDRDKLRRMELGEGMNDLKSSAATKNSPGFGKLANATGKGQNTTKHVLVDKTKSNEEILDLMRQSLSAIEKMGSAGKADDTCCKELKEAVASASGKEELIEIRDILLRIEQKEGTPSVSLTPEQFADYMKKHGQAAAGYFGRAGQAARGGASKIFNALKSGAKSSLSNTLAFGKKAKSAIFSAGSGAFSWLGKQKDKFDLYIDGEVMPRLQKWKLDNGKYMDVNTGKIIEKFSDITGDVKDIETGEIVLRYGEIKKAILKNVETGKSVLATTTDWGKRLLKTAKDSLTASAKSLFGLGMKANSFAMRTLKAAYENLTDGPMDVYLKDQYETPVLLKRTMAAGLYFDKDTLDPITKVSEIKGAVVDNQENVLITKEDLANGLYNKHGQEIKTGFDRITQFVGNSFKKTLQTYRKILGGAKDLGAKAMGWMKGLFGFDSPFTIFSRTTNDILAAIYNLLNNRMPGERSPELDTLVGKSSSTMGSGGKLKAGFSKLKEKASELRDKLAGRTSGIRGQVGEKFNDIKSRAQAYKAENWDDIKGGVKNRATRGKDAVVDGLHAVVDTLRDRLPEAKKKIFGDSNGDGVRDGSIDDLRAKRHKTLEEAEAANKQQADKDGKKGPGFLSKLAALFGKKKDGEEDEEKKSGGGLLDGLLGDDGGKGSDKKEGKPRGRFGKMWDKFKGKITPKGSGMGARAARFGGRLLGGLGRGAFALGRFGVGALLGGGLFSASTLMSGLSLVGSALGMAGSALGAVLSSPITVPALALAAAGTGAYFAYKWLTKPDPKPIEKVRLVQYGWKAKDIEAYKKMKTLESKVAGLVSFQGEKAEFDSSKLNIQDLMKVYDLDPKNKDHAKKFVDWFANRFRPIYLQHRALIKIQNPGKELENIDDAKAEAKQKYLDECQFPGDHYLVTTSPFKDQEYTYTSEGSVTRQIKVAKAEIEKEDSKKETPTGDDAAATSAAALAAAKKAADANADRKKESKLDEKDAAKGVPDKAGGNVEKNVAFNRLAAATTGTMNGPGSPGNGPGGDMNGPASADGASSRPKSRGDVKPTAGAAAEVKAAMIKMMPKYGITTPNQQAALLGNVEHESGFKPIAENLNYKPATMVRLWPNRFSSLQQASAVAAKGPEGIANSIYGGRMGNTEPNDGWDYRGRGPIQITGKSNYAAISKIIGKDIVNDPDKLITDPVVSAESALAYWKMNPQLGKYADAGNFLKVRQLINGGNIGAEDALASTQNYLQKIQSGSLQGLSGAPGTLVASPKPDMPNVASSSGGGSNEQNTGPAPEAMKTKAVQMAQSPRPNYNPVSSSSYTAPATRATPNDSYFQEKSSINTGDSISIMKESLKTAQETVSVLTSIRELLQNQPKETAAALAELFSTGEVSKSAEPPSEKNNYGKGPSKTLPEPSVAFRRKLVT